MKNIKGFLVVLVTVFTVINFNCIVNAKLSNNDNQGFGKMLSAESDKQGVEDLITGDNEKIRFYFELADTYMKQQDYENAIKYYSKVIELNDDCLPAYSGKAFCCSRLKDNKCALENYDVLKKAYPDDPELYWYTSMLKDELKDLDGAMQDIDKAISMVKKPNAKYYAQKAMVHTDRKEHDKAVEYIEKALKIDPHNPITLGAYMFMAVDNDNYKEVIKISKFLLKHDSRVEKNSVLYCLYAGALYNTGDKKNAIKKIDKAIQLEPNNKDYLEMKEKMIKGEKID